MSSALERFPPIIPKRKQRTLLTKIWKERWLYALLVPGLAFFIIYKYFPMAGLVLAFENFQPQKGVFGSPWVGLEHFTRFFSEPAFWQLFRNTLVLAFYGIVFYFPVPIILALLLNELRVMRFKRFVQSVTYVPYFLSWVVVAGVTYNFLSADGGVVNSVLSGLGINPVDFLVNPHWFRPIVVLQDIWKDAGWGSIIFLAALAGIDPQLYESATIEGAGRWQQLWYVTLPSIRATIIIILILRLGRFLDLRVDQILLMINALNRNVGDVFDTYVYRTGILQAQFGYSTAVGLFKSVVGLILVVAANRLAKLFGEEGVY